jgi:hypothetical protein
MAGNLTVNVGIFFGDNFGQGGFPHSGRAEYRVESGFGHGKREVVDNGNITARIGEIQVMAFKMHSRLQEFNFIKFPLHLQAFSPKINIRPD